MRACLGGRTPLPAPPAPAPAPLPASAVAPFGAAAVIPAPGIACERAAAAAQAAAAIAQAALAAAAGSKGPATHFSECPNPLNHCIESSGASIVRRATAMRRPYHYIGIGLLVLESREQPVFVPAQVLLWIQHPAAAAALPWVALCRPPYQRNSLFWRQLLPRSPPQQRHTQATPGARALLYRTRLRVRVRTMKCSWHSPYQQGRFFRPCTSPHLKQISLHELGLRLRRTRQPGRRLRL